MPSAGKGAEQRVISWKVGALCNGFYLSETDAFIMLSHGMADPLP